nr:MULTISPECIES: SapC family protein [unclassified Campylobacter]
MNIVALNSEIHKNLRYTGGKIPNTAIAKITVSEMKKCAENFCIVFTNDVVPTMVVLLGQTENVMIDDEFSGYIPASLKNYPFLLGNADGKRVLCVDMDSDHLSENDKGERLFGDNENKSEFLDKVIVALKNYDSDFKRTQLMMEELKKSGILINKELNLKVADENYVLIKGFSVVSRSKLNELDDKTLAMFVRNGYMDLINIHLSSLSNFQTLASRILEK